MSQIESSIIHVLAPEVVDQIAAGEVVERPAHMVKELVENALDAGASRIEVNYCDGGRWVQVRDNGKGLSPIDMPKALQRFATSKIKESDDLWKLSSFGFRGEALASIASVSRFTMISKRASDESATRMVSEFGKVIETDLVGGTFGTSVTVEKLFANVPARLKFLKSDSAEGSQIKTMMKAMALSHFESEFRLEENGKLIWFAAKASSRLERAMQILEVKPMFEGKATRGNVTAYAVFADPHQVARTSRNIWLFAQNRWIQDRGLQAAVMEAYRNLLMHGEYPIAAVWVETDPSAIDVNIHPTKSAVKFQDPSLAFRAVAASLRDTLELAPWIQRSASSALEPSQTFSSRETTQATSAQEPFQATFSQEQMPAFSREQTSGPSSEYSPRTQAQFTDSSLYRTQYNEKSFDLELASRAQAQRQELFSDLNKTSTGYWSSLQVLGQLNLTYIMCQSDSGLVMVDQHAAHERVAFEQLMDAWNGGRIDVQDYLFPLAVDLSVEKVEALVTQISEFARLGVHLEVLGPATIGVKAAPSLIKDSSFAAVLENVANDILEKGGSFQLQKTIADICATLACHSVVRAGQTLSAEQMKELLANMDFYPLSSFCPHGRPVSVVYPFAKIEKEFGRTL